MGNAMADMKEFERELIAKTRKLLRNAAFNLEASAMILPHRSVGDSRIAEGLRAMDRELEMSKPPEEEL